MTDPVHEDEFQPEELDLDVEALVDRMAVALVREITADVVQFHILSGGLTKSLLENCRYDARVMLEAILPDIKKRIPPKGAKVLVPKLGADLQHGDRFVYEGEFQQVRISRRVGFEGWYPVGNNGGAIDEAARLYVEWKP